MATKCLVTTLDEVVNNPNLPRLNATMVTFDGTKVPDEKKVNGYALFAFRSDHTDLEIIDGDGVFTNSSATANNGTTKTNCPSSLNYIRMTGLTVMVIKNLHLLTYWSTLSTDYDIKKYISYDIRMLLQGSPEMTSFACGKERETSSRSDGDSCTGDVSTMEVDSGTVYLAGCGKLSGSMDHCVQTLRTEENVKVSFYATKLKFNTRSLEGKNNVAIYCNANTTGDIKYYGDTRNLAISAGLAVSNKYTGTVEELIQRLVAQGRTGGDDGVFAFNDYFGFKIRSDDNPQFSKVEFQNTPLPDYYGDSLNTNSYSNIKFTWRVDYPAVPLPAGDGKSAEVVIYNPETERNDILVRYEFTNTSMRPWE